ncbi:hypothetical protein, partial [Salmonella enterica]|uniref:hypothetical protein n=1 Tax=Salmonella enterica TaxID=28901 RepID=UPI000A450607
FYVMMASGYGDVAKDEGGTIHLQGAGVYGGTASRGKTLNKAKTYLDAHPPTQDDENNSPTPSSGQPPPLYPPTQGRVADPPGPVRPPPPTNPGNITTNTAGSAMMALNGETAINQGVIT